MNSETISSGGKPTYQEVCGDFKNRTGLQNQQNADKWREKLVSDWTGYLIDVRQEPTPGGLGLIQLPTALVSFTKNGQTAHAKMLSLVDIPLFRAKKGDKVTFSGQVSEVEIVGDICVVSLLSTTVPAPTPALLAKPTPVVPANPTSAPTINKAFEGRWTASFTFERSTKDPNAPRNKWFTFDLELHQEGDKVTGTMKGVGMDVSGTLTGTVDKTNLRGVMRLSWDTQDWESFALSLAPDGISGTGAAIFRASVNERHFYSIQLSRQ